MTKKTPNPDAVLPVERVKAPHIHITHSEDRQRAHLEITSGRKKIAIDLTGVELTGLIAALGAARQAMLGTEPPPIEGVSFSPVRRTNWALQLDPDSQGSILAFQHPAYGPVGIALTPQDSATLGKGLAMHQQLNAVTLKAGGPAN